MTIFVDGYNVLKTVLNTRISARERHHFIIQLKKYASLKKHTIVLVFDGESVDEPLHSSYGSVEVLYSGERSADDVMLDKISCVPKNQVLVVSDDRILCASVSDMDCVSIDVRSFCYYLTTALQTITKSSIQADAMATKTGTSNNAMLDELMSGNMILPLKDQCAIPGHKSSHHKESKSGRRLIKIMQKL